MFGRGVHPGQDGLYRVRWEYGSHTDPAKGLLTVEASWLDLRMHVTQQGSNHHLQVFLETINTLFSNLAERVKEMKTKLQRLLKW